MELTISKQAQQWFDREITLNENQGIRFYGKVYGSTPIHEGFSVGLSVDTPQQPIVETIVDNRLYFIEETDQWFFANHDLIVDYDEKLDEPCYRFVQL
ncbi:MAG TPA: iron-sulfur cluster biosynthesis protein [Enterococcus columbae]|nr:iron-sulfur cluster biosynthesis protein [Enterococcus columbae]